MTEPRQHPQSDAKEAKASPPDPKVDPALVEDLDVADEDDTKLLGASGGGLSRAPAAPKAP